MRNWKETDSIDIIIFVDKKKEIAASSQKSIHWTSVQHFGHTVRMKVSRWVREKEWVRVCVQILEKEADLADGAFSYHGHSPLKPTIILGMHSESDMNELSSGREPIHKEYNKGETCVGCGRARRRQTVRRGS